MEQLETIGVLGARDEAGEHKRKTKGILIGMIAAVIAAVAGVVAYKATH
ncbi:MAG: hypothetical protein MRZ49_06580 [Lachnospiraceae bacterium]|nr:hypothetical protein [Lachnospiraceae bacterium]